MRGPNLPAWVLPLHAAGDAPERVGAKAATLGRLARAGFAVPEGFVLCVEAATAPGEDVSAALKAISDRFGDATLAVRSSAPDEDRPDASFAGQYETVLDVNGPPALRAAVTRCWQSAASERVRRYRQARGRGGAAAIAVLVQRQVAADVAGVVFTADPVTGSRDAVLVSAVPGLGDGLVNGQVSPDEWSVAGATATAVRVSHQALAAQQACAVAALAKRIEQTLGGPQDIEWAMADGRLQVLQARPVTALPCPPEVPALTGSWVKEVDRHPEPLTAFGASLAAPLVARGLTNVFASYGGLLERMQTLSVGGELYLRPVPFGGHDGAPPPWWALALTARIVPALRRRLRLARLTTTPQALDELTGRWSTVWRPHLKQTAARLRAVRLDALTDERLADHFDEVRAAADRAMDIHFRLVPPHVLPIYDLVRCCEQLLGWTAAQTLDLLGGLSDTSSEPTRELAAVARLIRQQPAARQAVAVGDAVGLADRLREAAPVAAAAFDDWTQRYAYRNVNNDPGSPVFAERPWILAELLRAAVGSDDAGSDGDPADGPGQPLGRARERLAKAREQLAYRTAADRDRFERLLAAALRAYPLREDVAFWTGSVFGGQARLVAIEAGRRLVARGVLGRAEDTVHLDADTLRDALADVVSGDAGELWQRVTRARAEREWVRQHPGPPFLGPPPGPPPDLRGLPRPARRLNEAMLWAQPGAQRAEPADASAGPAAKASAAKLPAAEVLVAGVAASPGQYSGPARLIRGEADFGRLRPGDVLVCPTTDPAWSVLFGIAGALVTDRASVLSHAAIVAREHGIPAVVGTGRAMRTLHDGDLVIVDGTAGTVGAIWPSDAN